MGLTGSRLGPRSDGRHREAVVGYWWLGVIILTMPPIVPSPNHQAMVCHHQHQLTKELSQRAATAGAPIGGRGGVIITQRPNIACLLPSQTLEPHSDPIIISKPSLSTFPSSSPTPPAHREISKHGPGAWGPPLGDGFHPQGAPSYQPTCLTYNSSHPVFDHFGNQSSNY